MCERELSVCKSQRARERERVSKRERERERENECMPMCVRETER